MWEIFRRGKGKTMQADIVQAAARGHAKSTVYRSVATIGIEKANNEESVGYVSRAALELLKVAKKNAELESSYKEDPWLDGVCLMVFTNHLCYLLEEKFEFASTLALTHIFGLGNPSGIAEVINSFNEMTKMRSNTIVALGNACASWVDSPSHENTTRLRALYSLLWQHSSKQSR